MPSSDDARRTDCVGLVSNRGTTSKIVSSFFERPDRRASRTEPVHLNLLEIWSIVLSVCSVLVWYLIRQALCTDLQVFSTVISRTIKTRSSYVNIKNNECTRLTLLRHLNKI